MRDGAQRVVIRARAIAIGIAACAVISCASIDPGSFLPEDGFHYGVGTGPSKEVAAEAARRDLISGALTTTRDRSGIRGGRIEIGVEAARGFNLPKLRPYAQKKAVDSVCIAYRLKIEDWEELEQLREAGIRAEIAPRVAALRTGTTRPLAERMIEARQLLERLAYEGLTDLLTEAGPGTPLVSRTIESACRDQAGDLAFSVSPQGGFIDGDTTFTVQAATRNGNRQGSLPIRAEWTAEEAEPLVISATTDGDGRARLEFPPGAGFRNRAVHLAVSTNLSPATPVSGVFTDIDTGSVAEYRYHHFDDIRVYFAEQARVPAGAFAAGALARDRRASSREAPRAAETAEFLIDRHPVTNALYRIFLEDTRSESFPEYWENPAYNQRDQPVVGVSWEDARRFAAWLSEHLGVVRRLPTEDEWEKAARAGKDVIYPWGDESPTVGARANYSGNGRFDAPSPVGSFPAGANAYGVFDMAGNVWQWTSTAYTMDLGGNASAVIVKGGSWMDGPSDLRVSSRRDVDPAKVFVDVGFRLVTEVSR
jgi:hypothetical protein